MNKFHRQILRVLQIPAPNTQKCVQIGLPEPRKIVISTSVHECFKHSPVYQKAVVTFDLPISAKQVAYGRCDLKPRSQALIFLSVDNDDVDSAALRSPMNA